MIEPSKILRLRINKLLTAILYLTLSCMRRKSPLLAGLFKFCLRVKTKTLAVLISFQIIK